MCCGQGREVFLDGCFHLCFVPSLHWGDTACSLLQPSAPHPSPGSCCASPSSLPVCPRAARGEPEGRGRALSPQAGSRALQKPAAGSPPVGPAATSSHYSALHFPGLLAASPNSVSLMPYPSHALSLHLVSSISLSAPSPCALAAAPSCCAGWELPSCSPWGGSRGLLCTPGGHQHHPGDGSHLPHPSDPNSTCQGGETALQWPKGRGRLWLSSAGWSRDHQPMPRAGETPHFDSSQPPA